MVITKQKKTSLFVSEAYFQEKNNDLINQKIFYLFTLDFHI